jgi:pre-mRNA-splicing factor CWC22
MSPQATFEDCFAKQYAIIHRLETNKLRNVAKLFAHLLSVDAISWGVLGCIRLTEDDTTSSSRIFIKYLFQVGIVAGSHVCVCSTRYIW